jgi:hypothetical protein
MADHHAPDPVLLVVACFSRHATALDWSRGRLEETFGAVGLESLAFDFTQTRYYETTMGPGLRKKLMAFENLVTPNRLAEIKCTTNALERELAGTRGFPESRPINLDPGFLSLGKFVLATTKDQAQRIYLSDGIYAEVTLRFHAGRFEPWPWTYADYQLPEVRAFLGRARDWYRQRLRSVHPSADP